MIDLKIQAPNRVSTKELREDLHGILTKNHALFVRSEAALSLYGYSVQQSWSYAVKDRYYRTAGRVTVLTNDLNYFEELTPFVPRGKISYSAKITFTDFDLDSKEFRRLKQDLDQLNRQYLQEAGKWSLL